MRNMKYNIILGIALICVSLFTACDNFEFAGTQTPIKNGYGRISIILSEEGAEWQSARSVFPSSVFSKYKYIFAKDGADGAEIAPGSDGFFILETGSYTVAVQAYIDDEDNYTLAASGVSVQFNVGSGNNNPIKVPLIAVTGEEKGIFNYTITYPAGAQAEITLKKWSGMNDIELTPEDINFGGGKTQELELDPGSYLLTILISKNKLYAGLVEAIHIYPMLKTEYSKSFTNDDLHAVIPPTVNDYDISGTGIFTYDGSEKTVSIIRKANASPGAVTILYNGTETVPINTGTYTVTFNVGAADDYKAATGLPAGVITINKANGAAVSAPTLDTKTDNSITINAVSLQTATGQSIEYGISTSISESPSIWQSGTTFTGLNSAVYYVYARSASDDNYNAGNASGAMIIITTNIFAFEMVQIPAGTFTMGSPATEPGRWNNEGPQHSVTLSSFKMGKYQVTQEQYQAVMGSNPSYFKSAVIGESRTPGKLPVEKVSWYDALVFCNILSILEGLNPVYSINGKTDPVDWGTIPTDYYDPNRTTWDTAVMDKSKNGYRLPTEAQWEYACRAGTTTAYNTGDTISDNTGWYADNSGSKTHQVGLKLANAWGLHDMHGNVLEWCWDWYEIYSSGSQTDPVGAVTGSSRVVRGGNWGNDGLLLRSAYRDSYGPYYRNGVIGFRLVRSLD